MTDIQLQNFQDFLLIEKNLSQNTIQAYISDLQQAKEHINIAHTNIHEHIQKYIQNLHDAKLSSSSIARKCSALKQFYLFHNIDLKIKLPSIINLLKIVNYQEIIKLIECAENLQDKTFLYFLFTSGCRVSEALSITKIQVQECIKHNKLHLNIIGKGDKERTIFLTEKTLDLLKSFLSTSENHIFVFESKRTSKALTRQWAHKLIQQLSLKANIDLLHPHAFRHAQAMLLLESGADIIAIKNILGHAHLSSTEKYLQLHWKHLEEAIALHPLQKNQKYN